MRYVVGFMCVLALGVLGCSETSGTAGSGGLAGSGGDGGTGGMPECQSPEDCDDGNECTEDTCTDGVCESMAVADGTACDDDASRCRQGTCAPSTTWRATTNPPGGVAGATDGCTVFVTALNENVNLDVTITLDALYDASAGELTTGYTVAVTWYLMPSLSNGVAYGNLSVETAITDGTPATVTNEANPAAIGKLIGEVVDGNTLTFATPDEILSNTEAVTSTSSPIEVNFSGRFNLLLPPPPDCEPPSPCSILFEVDESMCVFDEMGAAIEL